MVRTIPKGEIPVENLEFQLMHSLRPVRPDPQFVDHLHDRLNSPEVTVLERRQNIALGLLLFAFSLLGGLLLVWGLRQIRVVVS